MINNSNNSTKNTDSANSSTNKSANNTNNLNDKKTEAGKDVNITSPETAVDKITGAINSVLPSDDEEKKEDTERKPKYTLTIDEGVVEKISSLAAQNVDGIVDMKGSVFSMIQEGLGGNDDKKGADADISDGAVTVELSIILEYGKSALEVFDNIKETVTDQVKEMTGLEVAELTVNVVDVVDKAEYDKLHGNSDDGEKEKRTAVTLSK
ncbi:MULTISPECIES: Asp23/Gls24 family envelope stress response protein [unclassified Adlercreutzia]|uniref:Asp23/Gls24 family envelope stress response protein n=1 Tax=unclassified Adlercreutzia TaxID=2636013 RepID=UPI0013EDC069|nr:MULTISPECIES: Asp23/Gls24 family envelope stress response protein [unclassified Adlercreutzia]